MKKNVFNTIIVLMLPFGFTSCTYLLNTEDPNPYRAFMMGIYRDGLEDWEEINKYKSLITNPDYCIFRAWQGYASLSCYEKLNSEQTSNENSKVLYTSCGFDYTKDEFSYKEFECSSYEQKMVNPAQYERWMRFSGKKQPKLTEEVNIFFRKILSLLGLYSFLLFPLFLIITLTTKGDLILLPKWFKFSLIITLSLLFLILLPIA